MKNKIKIFFTSQAQFEAEKTNLGEKAIFEEALSRFKKHTPNAEIKVLSSNPQKTESAYQIKAIKLGGFINFLKSIIEVAKSDYIIVGGGELIQDKSSLFLQPYLLFRPFIGWLFGKKLIAQGVGIGESDEITKFGKWQAKFILNRFKIITLRDRKSLSMLKALKITKPRSYVAADIANTLNKPEDGKIAGILKMHGIKENEKIAVLSMRSVYHRSHNLLPFNIRKKLGLLSKKYFAEIEHFKKTIAQTADYINRQYGLRIVFVPAYTGSNFSAFDDIFSKEIMKYVKCDSVCISENSCGNIKGILSKAEFVIAVPLHALILAGSENVPVIAISYASKHRAYMEQIEMGNYVVKAENIGDRLEFSAIKKMIDNIVNNREHIVERLETINKNIKSLSREATSHIFDYINNQDRG